MKSSQEFRIAVYDKWEQKKAAGKRRKKRVLLCAPLAAAVLLCGLAAPRIWDSAAQNAAAVPLALQVGRPAQVKRVGYEYFEELQEGLGKEPGEITEEEWEGLDEEFQEAVAENQYIDKNFQTALNEFARDFAGNLSGGFSENDCYSPLSLYYALAMAGTGAEGDTRREFENVLNAPEMGWAAEQCGKYYRQHYQEEDRSTLRLVNSLWMDGRCQFSRDFIDGAENDFYSTLFQADFTTPAVADEMGKWVSENTGGLLEPEFEFSKDTMLSLMNTVYFRAWWRDEFLKQNNRRGDFTRLDGSTVTVEYMRQRATYGSAFRGENFLRASRGLTGGFQMIFILPDEGVDPKDLLRDPDAFEQMFYPLEEGAAFSSQVNWSVPKFSFESQFDLTEALKSMGLSSAFREDRADFSGMLSSECESLYLSQARQGVYVGLDEEGVEAAAYTELAADAAGAAEPPEEIVDMDLNRPFLFAIAAEDNVAGQGENSLSGHSLLFVGVCGEPDPA